MGDYGQFCPVAKAAEVLDERWTLLVVRELVAGSDQFNDIHRGVPRMSRSLLTKRLRSLARHGLLERTETAAGPRYSLTPAGRELEPVIEAVGAWGLRRLTQDHDATVDPALLVWDMHRSVHLDALPPGRTVVELAFTDVPRDVRSWWLVLTHDEVDVCDEPPGGAVDIVVEGPASTLVRVWLGDVEWSDVIGQGGLEVRGPTGLRRALPSWFRLSPFASVPRP